MNLPIGCEIKPERTARTVADGRERLQGAGRLVPSDLAGDSADPADPGSNDRPADPPEFFDQDLR